MMGKNFFKDLAELEQSITQEGYTLGVLRKLIGFVESGVFTKSESMRFICSNWRLTSGELARKWNDENCDEKSAITWRSQVSTLSRQLYDLFPAIYESFSENRVAEVGRVAFTVTLLEDGDESYSDIFIKELSAMSVEYSGKGYDISDCESELCLLSKLTRKNIYDDIDCINRDKLGYLKTVLQTPLLSNRYRSVNLDKVLILRKLIELGSDGVKEPEVEKVDNYSQYGFDSMSDLVTVLNDRVLQNQNRVDASSISDKTYKKVSLLMKLFSVEGLTEFVSSIPADELYTILDSKVNVLK